ncbi:MAG: hypothetical protein KC493_06920 [Bacteriovoracaceae bacterium]|nr:hypothetical protein [Bacteriovoracaceae bacterium]
MKKILLLAVMIFSTSVFAEDVRIKKTNCTMFGNLKVKVSGLESFGRLGTGYLRANVPVLDSCREVMMTFNQTMGRGTSSVDVDLTKETIIRREHRNDNKEMICTTVERSTLSVVFPNFSEYTFKNITEKIIDRDRYCN